MSMEDKAKKLVKSVWFKIKWKKQIAAAVKEAKSCALATSYFPEKERMAFNASGNEVTTLVAMCFAAVAGGGVFGDHCSPVSDTTILSSMGAASDHIDHVKTQLPYALIVAVLCAVAYLILGIVVA